MLAGSSWTLATWTTTFSSSYIQTIFRHRYQQLVYAILSHLWKTHCMQKHMFFITRYFNLLNMATSKKFYSGLIDGFEVTTWKSVSSSSCNEVGHYLRNPELWNSRCGVSYPGALPGTRFWCWSRGLFTRRMSLTTGTIRVNNSICPTILHISMNSTQKGNKTWTKG